MAEAKHVEERMVRRGDVNMRLIINHAHAHLRFMDFRVGNYEQKRAFLDEVAAENKLNKVFTLVEKQDSQNWRAATFVKEGVFPSFFRTADAHVMARLYDRDGRPLAGAAGKRPEEPKLPPDYPSPHPPAGARLEVLRLPDEVDAVLSEVDARDLTVPFSRTEQPELVMRGVARSIRTWVAAELEDSFGHAILGMSPVPANITGRGLSRMMLDQLCDDLAGRAVNNCFMLVRLSDTERANVLMDLGFKVTGRLARHLGDDDEGEMALVWHLKVTNRGK